MLRLTFESFEAQVVRGVAGEQARRPERRQATFLVRLMAGEPKDLFETQPQAEPVQFAVCRVGGEPCIAVHARARRSCGPYSSSGRPDRVSATATATRGDRAPFKGTLWKAQELLREGRPERAMKIGFAYATEVERPALALLRATAAAHDDEWLANVNAYVGQFDIAPIRLEKTNAPRFFRLAADAPLAASGGPLVTVIMPAYNAEKTLELAATSILSRAGPSSSYHRRRWQQ